MLANIRGSFSEAQIGSIAYQIMGQLNYLHSRQLICKYLTPRNISVLQGFEPAQNTIQLRIVDIAMI